MPSHLQRLNRIMAETFSECLTAYEVNPAGLLSSVDASHAAPQDPSDIRVCSIEVSNDTIMGCLELYREAGSKEFPSDVVSTDEFLNQCAGRFTNKLANVQVTLRLGTPQTGPIESPKGAPLNSPTRLFIAQRSPHAGLTLTLHLGPRDEIILGETVSEEEQSIDEGTLLLF